MIGTDFLDYLSKFQVATYVGVEDFADKFNFLITVMVLMLCTTIVTVKQYMMKPISCYMATDLGGKNLLDYVENYCWVQGTVPIAYSGRVPETDEGWAELEKHKLLYYQWVPFVLGLQCILFYLPRLIWQMICYNRVGTDVQHLVLCANQAVHANDEQRTKMVQHLAKTLEQLLFQQREYHHGLWPRVRRRMKKWGYLFFVSKRLGTRLFGIYLFIKCLYLLNAIGQIFMMQSFLGLKSNYTLFGVAISRNILAGLDWEVTMIFPRVGFCLVPLKHFGSNNYATAQCVLPVNMLNERIYMFLWFWIVLAATITAISIPTWFTRMSYEKSRTHFIKKYLKLGEKVSRKDKYMVEKFTLLFLRNDGVFLLRMIAINAGELICSEIVCQLWHIFREKYFYRDLTRCKRDCDQMHHLGLKLSRGIVNLKERCSKENKQPRLEATASAPPLTDAPLATLGTDEEEGGYADDDEDEQKDIKRHYSKKYSWEQKEPV
uniref:Innexin n=2 Tax=Schistosoma mansoni TaxID=6183 RepID=A0A3Q0KLG6_SCHMA